jgi:hypothetical protein
MTIQDRIDMNEFVDRKLAGLLLSFFSNIAVPQAQRPDAVNDGIGTVHLHNVSKCIIRNDYTMENINFFYIKS